MLNKEKKPKYNVGMYVGSFDPFTIGHYSILQQAIELFDDVVVCVAENINKQRRFNIRNTLSAIRSIVPKNIQVTTSKELMVDVCRVYDCKYLIRGLRNTSDYLYEESLYQMYKELDKDLRVIYLRSDNNISSSFVYELYKRGKNIDKYVPYSPNLLEEKTE